MDNSLLAAQTVATMLHQLRERPAQEELRKPDLRQVIDSAIDRRICAGTMEFARAASIGKGTLSDVLNGSKGNLELWVRASLVADVSLAGLFVPELWLEGVRGRSISWTSQLSPPRKRHALDWDSIDQRAIAEIGSPEPLSVHQLSKELGIDPKHLRHGLRELADELDSAALTRKVALRTAAVEELSEQMCSEGLQMIRKGARVSARALSRRMGQGRTSEAFRLAYPLAIEWLAKSRSEHSPNQSLQIGESPVPQGCSGAMNDAMPNRRHGRA